MSVEDLVGQVRQVVAAVGQARACLVQAQAELGEARDAMAAATYGTSDAEVGQLVPLMESLSEQLGQSMQTLDAASGLLTAYVERVGGPGDAGATIPPPPPSAPSPRASASDVRERVEQLRRQLPTRSAGERRQKTHGRWFAPGQDATELVSGVDALTERVNEALRAEGCPRRPVTAAADVELKLAAHMRDQGVREATLVINNEPCRGDLGCDTLVPAILPEGYSLTVFGPGGFEKRYTGGVKPWSK